MKSGRDGRQKRERCMPSSVLLNDSEWGDLEHANGGVPALGRVGIGAQLLDDPEKA